MSLLLTLNIFYTLHSCVSIIDFEQINVCCVAFAYLFTYYIEILHILPIKILHAYLITWHIGHIHDAKSYFKYFLLKEISRQFWICSVLKASNIFITEALRQLIQQKWHFYFKNQKTFIAQNNYFRILVSFPYIKQMKLLVENTKRSEMVRKFHRLLISHP